MATLWDAHAWLWHGYELRGLEHLPTQVLNLIESSLRIILYTIAQGGALLVYYHGAIPVDYYYLVNRVLLLKEVMVRSVVDKFLFKV